MIRTSLSVALGIVAALAVTRACASDREAGRLRTENLRLRTEAAQERIRAAGYQTVLARVQDDLRAALEERDHWRALAREADAEPVALVTAEATAEAHIEGPAAPVADSTARVPVGYAGEYADSTFGLRWALLFGPPPQFEADLRARLPLELVGYRLPDGSYGVTAESPDPRVQVQVRDFVVAPPEPERRGIPWAWIAGAAVAAVVGWEMIR
ncbi:MAG TPA: hypothetical protein VF188_02765 [Longimicrobiales bacterium]